MLTHLGGNETKQRKEPQIFSFEVSHSRGQVTTALGKKNWLFFGDADSRERGAILYTIIECCRRRGINPLDYLRDVLTRLPNATNWTVAQLTPENWQKSLAPSRLAA